MNIKRYIKLRTFIYFALAASSIAFLILVTTLPNKYNWEMGKTNFSVSYTSVGTMVQGEINIKISENGKYEFIEYTGTANDSNRKVAGRYTGSLTNSDMEELFNYMINEIDFFKIRENISKEGVTDASYDYLEVKFEGNTHRVGGYAASLDRTFIKANKKLREINEKFIVKK